MKYAIIIPARYSSSRLPGKPLIEINGVAMIKRVWERCCIAVDPQLVYIATDSQSIYDFCKKFTHNVIMTSEQCATGTDRVNEAVRKIGGLDFVINVQGDEPIINPKDITLMIESYIQKPGCVINAMAQIQNEEEYRSDSIPKVVFREDGRLMYMSRAPIPSNKKSTFNVAWKQICIYAFPVGLLDDFASCNRKTLFENEEDIEILRFLEIGQEVYMKAVQGNGKAVDTPSDVISVSNILLDNPSYNL